VGVNGEGIVPIWKRILFWIFKKLNIYVHMLE
jgi:hypothetical protein